MDETGWIVQNEYACVLTSLGHVKCWGFPSLAAVLGQGNSVDVILNPSSISPIDFGAGRSVRQLTLGRQHACVYLDNKYIVRFYIQMFLY